jgi:methylglutaconyl-CoA hydratase
MSGVRYESAGGVATITMDEPESRNALTATIVDGIGDGLERAAADPDVRVVVLTNTGTTFCAGADLRGAGGVAPRRTPTEIYSLVLDSPKPVVARIAGHCMGGGLGLAAACDVSIAAADCRMGFTEVRLGVAPAIISVIVLPKMRRSDAAELMLTGRRFCARTAAELGLVTRAVAATALDDTTRSVVDELLEGAPGAQAAIKRMLDTVPTMGQDAAFAAMTALSKELFEGDEAREGVAAFRERRPASWAPAARRLPT